MDINESGDLCRTTPSQMDLPVHVTIFRDILEMNARHHLIAWYIPPMLAR